MPLTFPRPCVTRAGGLGECAEGAVGERAATAGRGEVAAVRVEAVAMDRACLGQGRDEVAFLDRAAEDLDAWSGRSAVNVERMQSVAWLIAASCFAPRPACSPTCSASRRSTSAYATFRRSPGSRPTTDVARPWAECTGNPHYSCGITNARTRPQLLGQQCKITLQ
jgi:hypothetical protein